jgi:hypothetical protein
MTSKRKLLYFGVLTLVALCGCSKSGSETVQPMKPNGITQTLAKRPGGPSWNIESVGANNRAWESKSFELPAHQELAVSGWAVDSESKKAAGGVEMVIDGAPYAAQYGGERPDVATFFGRPECADSGYVMKLPAGQFAAGSHAMFVRVLSSDRKSYWEVGPYTLNVK